MAASDWFRPPRSVLTLYLGGATAALACLTWLAIRQLNLDEMADAQRTQQRLAAVAERVAVRVRQGIEDLDRALLDRAAQPPPGAVIVRGDTRGVTVELGTLPFLPVAPPMIEPPREPFTTTESLELTDPVRASQAYRELAGSPSRAVRARALVGLGRSLRKVERHAHALEAYRQLAALGDVAIEGRPADLIARAGICGVLQAQGAREPLAREAAALRADLVRGRWPITNALWHAMVDAANTWTGDTALPADAGSAALNARVLDTFWHSGTATAGNGSVVVDTEAGAGVVSWRTDESGVRALVVGVAWLEARWRDVAEDADVAVSLSDPRGGRTVVGQPLLNGVSAHAAGTGLPWTIAVADADPDSARRDASSRRRTFLIGLTAVALVIVGSGYFAYRGTRRELAIARLHADFVSAASHEFRTPLTSIRQLSHMLKDGRVEGDDRRSQYYSVLVRESERLHRLVDRLLNFGRADTGRFQPEVVDARDLAAAVVKDFEQRQAGRTIDMAAADTPCPIRADRELLSVALWNLLDNAVKYSPDGSHVGLDVGSKDGRVQLAVRDAGRGIPAQDRQRIFEQFVRGPDAESSSTPGSGLGLALVDRIVRVHGGRVDLDSDVGRGSVFTISLPLETTA